MSLSTSVHDIKTLVLSSHPLIAIETVEEDRVHALLLSVAAQLRMPFFEWSITRGLTRAEESNTPHRLTASPASLLQHLEGLSVAGLFLLKDFSRHLDDAAVARQFRELAQRFTQKRSTAVLTAEDVRLPNEIEHAAVRYHLRLPDREELEEAIDCVLQSLGKHPHRDVQLAAKERDELLRALQGLTLNQARQAVSHAVLEEGKLTARAAQGVLNRKAQAIREGGLLEYYPVEDNRFQLGGFANLKAWLDRARVGFSTEARALNLTPPRGILIVGVPGCGKSLAAKVIAREWALPLLKLDAGRLFDKFIGESEKNFRKAIALAESMAPVVFWIDEIEKGMVAAGSGEADAGLSRRLFGAFLTWLQEKRQEVFVVATANDLSILPPELLRKGRFDEIFFVDLPTEEEREAILGIHLGLRKQEPDKFDLQRIVAASDGFSGAEIEQAVVAALYRALHLKRPLDTALLLEELKQTVPLSISRREDIARLRETARGRFVSVR
ncbi:MAG: AAA family ATPase [Nitrospirae bacterium]|nr:AAA family ATPase [Nitrospirota bacterium]